MPMNFPFEDKGFSLESQLASKGRKSFSFTDVALSGGSSFEGAIIVTV